MICQRSDINFPRTYLNQARQAVGDHIVYYEPRRSNAELSSFGGRQSYFGVARVTAVVEDTSLAGHYYALVDDYLDFDRPVPFAEGDEYYESALKKEDGSTNKGAFGRAVRLIPDNEFDRILKSGFAPILHEDKESQGDVPFDISEPHIPFERPDWLCPEPCIGCSIADSFRLAMTTKSSFPGSTSLRTPLDS
jgi:putative restriction endonuclease